MKKKTLNTEKNKIMFAFMPEMVLEHLNDATPTEIIEQNSNKPAIEEITISAEPEIPNLDSFIYSKKEKINLVKSVVKPSLEEPSSETNKNIITRFLKKIKC